jgi:CheY-like chemotaxis protein
MPGKKLLVADDSLTIQKVIRLALSNEGYEIQAVSDGNDAIQQILLSRPDIVLIDVSLPSQTAFEVKREINSHGDLEEVRFVLMSSAFEKVDEAQASEVLFHGRLTKPFDPAHLRQVLVDVLAQVTAKRMEKTSILQRPQEEMSLPSPPDHLGDALDDSLSDALPRELSDEVEKEDVHSNWDHPGILPDDLPPLPPDEREAVRELWDSGEDLKENQFKLDPPEFPTEEPIQAPHQGGEEDIRNLMESTYKMSGMEDYQWSVQEPSLKPFPKMLEPTVPPPPLSADFNFSERVSSAAANASNSFSPSLPLQSGASISPITQEQMESLIREQVEAALTRMAQKLLPEIAERLIKQEIHKMLSEN